MTDENLIEANLVPTYIMFEDSQGRSWKALALIAPLTAEDMDPVLLTHTKDLELKVSKIKIVRR